jgi:hypothetical protein
VRPGLEAALRGAASCFLWGGMDAVCADEPRLSGPKTAVAHAWMREPIYRELEANAVRRRTHTDALAAQIITAAVLLGCVDELIDKAIASLPS